MAKPPPLPLGVKSSPRFKLGKKAVEEERYDLVEFTKLISSSLNGPGTFISPKTDDTNVVITATELINDLLQFALITRFFGVHLDKQYVTKNDVTEAFNWRGPLGTLYARIVVCSSLNLVKKSTRADLDTIRDIRNAFCHTRTPKSFADPDITEMCKKLICNNQEKIGGAENFEFVIKLGVNPESRAKYVFAILCLAASLAKTIFISYRQIQFMGKHEDEMFKKPAEEFPKLASRFVADAFAKAIAKAAEDIRERNSRSSGAPGQTPEATATSEPPSQG